MPLGCMPLGLSFSAYQARNSLPIRLVVIVALRRRMPLGVLLSFASGARRYRSSSLRLPALCTSIAVFAITDSLRLPSLCVFIAAISITGALRVHDWLLLLGDKPWNLIRLALHEFIRASLVDSFARRFVRSSIRSLVDSFRSSILLLVDDSFARR